MKSMEHTLYGDKETTDHSYEIHSTHTDPRTSLDFSTLGKTTGDQRTPQEWLREGCPDRAFGSLAECLWRHTGSNLVCVIHSRSVELTAEQLPEVRSTPVVQGETDADENYGPNYRDKGTRPCPICTRETTHIHTFGPYPEAYAPVVNTDWEKIQEEHIHRLNEEIDDYRVELRTLKERHVKQIRYLRARLNTKRHDAARVIAVKVKQANYRKVEEDQNLRLIRKLQLEVQDLQVRHTKRLQECVQMQELLDEVRAQLADAAVLQLLNRE